METVKLVCELAVKYKESLSSRVSNLKTNRVEIRKSIEIFKEILDWRYSKGVFYTPFEFFNELAGFNQGKPVKKTFPSPLEARYQGLESAGFVENKLCLMLDSAKGEENARLAISRVEEVGGDLLIKRSNHYDFTSLLYKDPELISVSLISRISERVGVSSGVSVRGDFSFTLFEYGADGLVDCVYVYGTGFREPIRHQFYYDWRGLLKITVPSKNPDEESIVWKRKR